MKTLSGLWIVMMSATLAGCGSLGQINRRLKETLEESTETNLRLQGVLDQALQFLKSLLVWLEEVFANLNHVAEAIEPVARKTDQILGVLLALIVLYYRKQLGHLALQITGVLGLNALGRRLKARWTQRRGSSRSSSSPGPSC